jgi:hypothetical protein
MCGPAMVDGAGPCCFTGGEKAESTIGLARGAVNRYLSGIVCDEFSFLFI